MKNSPELLRLRSLTTDDLSDLYCHQRLSHSQIAERFDVSRTAVQNVLRHHGIDGRSNAESQTAINHHRTPVLCPEQEQLIYGSLLGDACLNYQVIRSNKTGKPLETYKLCFAHSDKHLDYLIWKMDFLGCGIKSNHGLKIGARTSGHGSTMRHFAFSHTPTLKVIASLCHDANHNKRLSAEWVDKLDWLGLAFWYMDDGTLALRDDGGRSIRFCTNSFSNPELDLLQEMLWCKFHLHSTRQSSGGKPGQQLICIHTQDDVDHFLDIMSGFVVPSMEHKVRYSGIYDERKSNGIRNARRKAS